MIFLGSQKNGQPDFEKIPSLKLNKLNWNGFLFIF